MVNRADLNLTRLDTRSPQHTATQFKYGYFLPIFNNTYKNTNIDFTEEMKKGRYRRILNEFREKFNIEIPLSETCRATRS